jgi:hypothetical protein
MNLATCQSASHSRLGNIIAPTLHDAVFLFFFSTVVTQQCPLQKKVGETIQIFSITDQGFLSRLSPSVLRHLHCGCYRRRL